MVESSNKKLKNGIEEITELACGESGKCNDASNLWYIRKCWAGVKHKKQDDCLRP